VWATGTIGWWQLVHFPIGNLGGIGIKKGTFGGNWYMPFFRCIVIVYDICVTYSNDIGIYYLIINGYISLNI
jgi:hypothetical protein